MKHKKILACFLAFSFLLTGCSTKDQSQSLSMTGTYFDTVVKIEVWGADSRSWMAAKISVRNMNNS